MYKGIDVSRWQGNIDFHQVKAAGIDFVIIKAGGSDAGFYTDKNFHLNVFRPSPFQLQLQTLDLRHQWYILFYILGYTLDVREYVNIDFDSSLGH